MTPYPVASVRPSEPPIPTGLPVMKPGNFPRWIVSNSSSIQSMCWAVVMTSGAGTSVTGPTSREIWRTHPRHICSCSRRLRLCGSQMTPPLLPPRGMSTTAHFHVIHIARARTVSMVSCGWNRMPPLPGPRASLCWTRNAAKDVHRTVIHADGNCERVLPKRCAQEFARGTIEADDLRHLVELHLGDLERVVGLLSHHILPSPTPRLEASANNCQPKSRSSPPRGDHQTCRSGIHRN